MTDALQAILNASDSSDDDDDNNGVMSGSSYRQNSNDFDLLAAGTIPLSRFSSDTSCGDIDLEQILREDEDEEDDEEDDNDNHEYDRDDYEDDDEDDHGVGQRYGSSLRGMSSSYGYHSDNHHHHNSSNGNTSRAQSSSPPHSSRPTSSAATSSVRTTHNEEDWAVLQAILREDDDDEDGCDDTDDDVTETYDPNDPADEGQDGRRLQSIHNQYNHHLGAKSTNVRSLSSSSSIMHNNNNNNNNNNRTTNNNKSPSNRRRLVSRSPSSNAAVEHLLAQSTEEDDDAYDDDDNDKEDAFSVAASRQQHRANSSHLGSPKQGKNKAESSTSTSACLTPLARNLRFGSGVGEDHASASERTTANDDLQKWASYSSSMSTTTTASPQSPLVGEQQEWTDDEASRRALEQAQTYERRLLKAGHRDIVSPLMVKRRLKPKITLTKRITASSSTTVNGDAKNSAATNEANMAPGMPTRGANNNNGGPMRTTSASTSLATGGGRFHTSGLIENKNWEEISQSLQKHAALDAKVKCGLPTCLAFNSRFIAIGTQLGIVLMFDLFGALRQRLGASSFGNSSNDDPILSVVGGGNSMRMVGAITSLDLSANGECCVVGYKSGMIVLWDTIRGSILRSVDDLHPSPIVSVRFYADMKLISADAGGLVNKATFHRNLLWSTYSMDAECLLDGTAGQILALNVLEPFAMLGANLRSRSRSLNRALSALSLIALSSERSSFAVAVEPRVSVLHRWARPPQDRIDFAKNASNNDHHHHNQQQRDGISSGGGTGPTVYLPCLAWGWALTSGAGNVAMPLLARSWGCCVQLLVSSFPTLEEPDTDKNNKSHDDPDVHWPAFGMQQEFDAEAPVVALEWLSERSLVYLTLTNELTVVDTVVMTLLERLDFSDMPVVFAEFSLSRSAAASSTTRLEHAESGEVEAQQRVLPVSCSSFQNSVRCSDQRLMVLCQDELRQISMIGAQQRISSLEADGEWLEALALALDYYEGTFASQEDRKRDPSRKRDLSKHPEFSSFKGGGSDEEEWIAKLLLRYLALAVDNAPNSNSPEDNLLPIGNGRARINLAQSHFQMLAGVCVEYCVTTKRLDLLFGPIFRRFQSVGYLAVFLDVLEPYVLNDRLFYMAPEVMSFFVEHCKSNNGVATVERCLLHMDCTIMDFDSIIALLRNNDMYSAMFFVFNQGLDDYVSPLQMLLERVFDEADNGNAMLRRGSRLQNDFDKFGYKAILYLRFCFQGKSFPKEEPILPEERQASVKPELLQFLTQGTYRAPDHAPRRKSGNATAATLGHRSYLYPYMRLLVQVDPGLLLETISDALNERSSFEHDEQSNDGSGSIVAYPTEQGIVDLLTTLILPELSEIPLEHVKLLKSRQAKSAFLDFTAKYITRGLVRVPKSLTLLIVKRIADRFANTQHAAVRRTAQSNIMELLSALSRESYEPDKVLAVIEKAGIHRAALLLHQQVASSSWQRQDDDSKETSDALKVRAHHFCSAIDCFIDDDDFDFRFEVFEYIRKECTGVRSDDGHVAGGAQRTLAVAVYSRLRRLVRLDALRTARLVAELFVEDLDVVVESLDADSDGGEAQFLFLQAIVSGELLEVDPVAGSVLNPSMSHHLKYLTLMAKLHPEKVYDYLSTHDNYRAEDALKLCEEYQIADASAYLLERMGNISSALQLILQTLEGRLMALKRTLRGLEVGLLRRPQMSSTMRFGISSDSKSNIHQLPSKQEKEVEGVRRILVVALDLCERNSGSYNAQTEHGSQLWFNVLDRLINAKGFLRLVNEQREHARMMENVLNDLLRLTMQRMVSNVPLLDLVRKVTSDHSGSRLGELREMIMSLLGTYGFELNLFRNASNVFHEDIVHMKVEKTDLVLRATPAQAKEPLGEEITSSDEGTILIENGAGGIVLEPHTISSLRRTAEGGFRHTLERLRSRRRTSSSSSAGAAASTSAAISLTATDQRYYEGAIEPVVYRHAVGGLGEAHHRGRLMSFRE
ncbi:hypothetical protein ACA910_009897 [Epithemia clementina (nom. ined.)]